MFYNMSEHELICVEPTHPPTITPICKNPTTDNANACKDNSMIFDCPVEDGSITIYVICSSCNKIQGKAWFKVIFKEGSTENVEYYQQYIHESLKMDRFEP